MHIALLTSHSIAEYDDLRMLTDLGYDVFSIGAYTNPWLPTDDKRPALDSVSPVHSDFARLCDEQREKHGGEDQSFVIDWAKGDLHPDIIDWADAIICHHFPVPWILAQWAKFKGKRVIWRTCGQSNAELEGAMGEARKHGLEIVRYSPKERALGNYAGEDAIIRFGKYPEDFPAWTGEVSRVVNVTQHLYQRHPATNWEFWEVTTNHPDYAPLPRLPIGPGSEVIGGIGEVTTDEMYRLLATSRAYLYTGTQPASYTLGLIEAMMVGTPVVSIGPSWMVQPDLFEWELAPFAYDDPAEANGRLTKLLGDLDYARVISGPHRRRAIETFGIETIGPQWKAYLG